MVNQNTDSAELSFLKSGGSTELYIRSLDWTHSSIGVPEKWPQSLRTVLGILLNSRFPMFLFWGPELICFYNDAYVPSLGKNGKHPLAIGMRGEEVWPEIWPQIKPQIDQVLAGGEATWHEGQLLPIFRNGRMENVYWTYSYSPVHDEGGTPGGVLVTCVETTKEVNNVLRLKESEERARLAIESSELGVYEVDLQTNSIVTNPRFNVIFGFGHPVSRHEFAMAIHQDDLATRENAHRDANKTGRLYYEVRVIWKDESIHWIKVSGKIFYDHENQPIRILGVVQEITEQKLFADELSKQVQDRTKALEETNRQLHSTIEELEQYAHVSSHDLQEPLRKILIYADMITSRDLHLLSEVSINQFNKITAAAGKLSKSLKDLLNFNSIDKDELFQPINVAEVLENVESDLEVIISQKAAVISYSAMPTISAIPVQVHQLFYNLVNNALKFARLDVSPYVRVTARLLNVDEVRSSSHLEESKSYCEFVISDNGIGFEQQKAERIFSMFHRLHDKEKYSGTGIGLALCKKVVKNHKGLLWAKSTPGQGSSFYIILPAD